MRRRMFAVMLTTALGLSIAVPASAVGRPEPDDPSCDDVFSDEECDEKYAGTGRPS